MIGWVYILRSLKSNRFYIGSAADVDKRIDEHNRGRVKSTKAFIPFELVFKQEYETYTQARSVEVRLKKYKRKDFLDKIVKDGIIKKS